MDSLKISKKIISDVASRFSVLYQKIRNFLKIKKNGRFVPSKLELDKKLVYSLSKSRVPSLRQIKYLGRFLTAPEAWVIRLSLLVFFGSFIFLGIEYYERHLQSSPVEGGVYVEGAVGSPKYVNPLYSGYSDVDGDISGLVFSSLFKRDYEGRLVNDLAESQTISEDGKFYSVKIKNNVRWHNGKQLTINDVVFTFNAIKNNEYRSPLRSGFLGVEAEKEDERTIKFVLTEAYAAFPELLTFGVIPEDPWFQISPNFANLAEINLKPIGSGPFKFKSLIRDKSGAIKSYTLEANNEYYGKAPYLEEIIFKFFVSFEEAIDALNNNDINGLSYLPKSLEEKVASRDSLNFYKINLPQVTSIFFNAKENEELKEKVVRQALAVAIDKQRILSDVFADDARSADGPILSDSFAFNPDNRKYTYNKEEAEKMLKDAGWDKSEITAEDLVEAEEGLKSEEEETRSAAEKTIYLGEGGWLKKNKKYLEITITVVDSIEGNIIGEMIKADWERIGVKTAISSVPAGSIQADVVRPRRFEALLFSQILGADPDLYVFWHSSQAANLNISGYANKDVDQLLEDARMTLDVEARKEKYKKFQEIITEEAPAIFLYSPVYTYVQNKKIKGFDIKNILTAKDRFSGVGDWYTKTGRILVW